MTNRTATTIVAAGLVAFALALAACSSSNTPAAQQKPAVPLGYKYVQPVAKTNPRVVEETDAYFVERYKKSELIRVDAEHVRFPIASPALRIYREDADYIYIRTEKLTPEEVKSQQEHVAVEKERERKRREAGLPATAEAAPAEGLAPADFASLEPKRSSGGVRFVKAGQGLPAVGQWRENIAVADMHGDGIPDIVATPARQSAGGGFYLWYGDGKGSFHGGKVEVVDKLGKVVPGRVGYGGVAVADFDGDGRLDVVTASHGGGIQCFLQREGGRFEVDDRGLPQNDFSTVAVAALDVDGDGRPDIVASLDSLSKEQIRTPDPHQVKVFVNDLKGAGWVYRPDALIGAFFSDKVFDLGKADVLTGSNALGATVLTWENDGKGKFKNGAFNGLEGYAYHQAVAPGTYGKDRAVAFADLYFKFGPPGLGRAAGINVYVRRGPEWKKIPVWREKDYKGRTTAVAMGDLNGDGLDDIVFPDRLHKKLRIFYQTPEGGFDEAAAATEPDLDSPVTDIHLADLNRDGKLDIVLAKTIFSESPADPGGIEVLLNQGN